MSKSGILTWARDTDLDTTITYKVTRAQDVHGSVPSKGCGELTHNHGERQHWEKSIGRGAKMDKERPEW
jgi:hypothetical protein